MSSAGKFVAQMLEASASGYAGLAASLLLERHPEIVERYDPDAFANWKAQLQRWLVDLSAALDSGAAKLFESRMTWTRSEFASRGAPVGDLLAALAALRDTLQEKLPPKVAATAVDPISDALRALEGTGAVERVSSVAAPAAALAYLETILAGNPREAVDRIVGPVDAASAAREVYLNVLMPAQREVGRLWHAGELTIAEEHVITTTTQRAMALLCERGRSSASTGKTVLLASVAGNVHDIGIRAISDFFEMAGWRSVNLGPDVPDDEIARSVAYFDADVLVLSAVLDPHLKSVRRVIERIGSLDGRKAKVIVGGPVFDPLPDLWRKIGADGHAARVEDAVPLAAKLTD
ncbi:MAG: hypothetical protein GTN89_02195 [Acidobacteria bacterium]|nr:hypothetical protein [Acidobacteriota bacterium]NIM61761.1 hypothetical protein [Acidobacteriota bacterium]NIO60005.1 hypothetical protein [Acidobacteriota bacterium]NIQ29197.1 hypothetical protein [Acidobacteriota bacterium]NIQ83771.1 hypothetical protein [Acidobacteriota bacterium]